MYAIGPILSRISNGMQYMGDNLAQILKFRELFLSLNLK